MSLVYQARCIVCTLFYKDEIIHANKSQIKNHIYYDHDYLEKLKEAVKRGLIDSIEERRSPKWLVDKLALIGAQ